MKIWAIDFHQDDTPSGWCYEWFSTKAECVARYDEITSDLIGHKASNVSKPSQIEVPSKRAALVRFLNSYAANGLSV